VGPLFLNRIYIGRRWSGILTNTHWTGWIDEARIGLDEIGTSSTNSIGTLTKPTNGCVQFFVECKTPQTRWFPYKVLDWCFEVVF
jgi:hypothetical protein